MQSYHSAVEEESYAETMDNTLFLIFIKKILVLQVQLQLWYIMNLWKDKETQIAKIISKQKPS